MFTLNHRHTLDLAPRLSVQVDRFLDLWERSINSESMTPEEEADFARRNNQEAEALERANRSAEK